MTDADLLLGKLDPVAFAGGRLALRPDLAGAAFHEAIARGSERSVLGSAFGAVEMVAELMANAARVHGVELGRDIRNHTMIAFGGAAPLHAARLAEKLGISRIIIPRGAGVGSALGFLMAPLSYDIVVGRSMRLEALTCETLLRVTDELRTRADCVQEVLGAVDIEHAFEADMRYVGQGHEIQVGFAGSSHGVQNFRNLFEERYAALFGRSIPDAAIEVIAWRLRLTRKIGDTVLTKPIVATASKVYAPAQRRVFDPERKDFAEWPVFKRRALRTGGVLAGPALIIEEQTTTVVTSSFAASIDEWHNINLQRFETSDA